MQPPDFALSRRELLTRCGTGLGMIGLASVLESDRVSAAENTLTPRAPHFRPRARHVIHLYMNGGPSQVDTFDPKPALEKYQGQRPASIAACDVALEELVTRQSGELDDALVRYFVRRTQRAEFVLQPVLGQIAGAHIQLID